jgi:hypothetical protein
MKHGISLWQDDFDELVEQYETKKDNIEYLLRLSSIRTAMANFVYITTNKNIPVKFSTGKQSYAVSMDKEEFIVISAETDPRRFDANVGVVLHEASHMMWSRRTIEEECMPVFEALDKVLKYPKLFITEELSKAALKIGHDVKQVQETMKLVMNVMEDRRIDKLMYQQAYGYRQYYEEMYDKMFNAKELEEKIATFEVRVPTVNNYFFHMILMTSPKSDPAALPGLEKIFKLINLNDIDRFPKDKRWKTWEKEFAPYFEHVSKNWSKLPEFLQAMVLITEEIYKNALKDEGQDTGKGKGKGTKYVIADPNNLDNPGGQSREMTEEEYKEFQEQLQEAIKASKGEQEKKQIDEATAKNIEQMEKAGVQMRETGIGIGAKMKAKCIVYTKLTKELLNSDSFIFSAPYKNHDLKNAIEEGARLGMVLANKIRVIADEFPIDYTRKSRGRMDKHLVHTLGYNNENVFHHSIIEKHQPVLVHLTVDSSGSMMGSKWTQSIKLAATLAKMAEQVKTINFTMSFRCSCNHQLVHILMAYDSRVDNFNKIREMFPYLVAAGGTPEGLSYETIKQIMLNDKTPKKYFINISDGQPSFAWSDGMGKYVMYEGETAYAHTAEQVKELRASNIEVLSYFVSSRNSSYYQSSYDSYDKNAFKAMYGRGAAFVSSDSVVDIARTLNKLFMEDTIG